MKITQKDFDDNTSLMLTNLDFMIPLLNVMLLTHTVAQQVLQLK